VTSCGAIFTLRLLNKFFVFKIIIEDKRKLRFHKSKSTAKLNTIGVANNGFAWCGRECMLYENFEFI